MPTLQCQASAILTSALKKLSLALVALCFVSSVALAQKLPSAEKVIENYIKAIGGKKRLAAIRDATYVWKGEVSDDALTIQLRAPGSRRLERGMGDGKMTSATNLRSSWTSESTGKQRTLTDLAAANTKLQALLDANYLLDYKKRNVLARVVSINDAETEPAYVVEFSMRNGARLRYWFATNSKLLIRIEYPELESGWSFSDYRRQNEILQPHLMRLQTPEKDTFTYVLQKVSFNTGLSEALFDPSKTETLDVVALLRAVSRNQDELEKRFNEYSFRQKETDREIDSKGVVKKETVKEYEVFPIANRSPVMKLISENGVALSVQRAAKEQKRVEEEFEKAERDKDKDENRVQKRRAERQRKRAARGEEEDDDLDVSTFLRIHDFVSPRVETFRDREAVVFDFRPRPDYKPRNREEDLISKLVGVVWIDPADKQVIRLEARLAEGFKMAGGLLFSLKPGAAFVMEQTRMTEGVWLPRQAQLNLTMKFLLFGGGDYNKTIEWSDYKHFSGDVGDYKLEAPKVVTTGKPE